MKKSVLLFMAVLFTTHLPAAKTFERSYGGTWVDEGFAVKQTSDGGYIIAGYTYSYSPDIAVYLIRTNQEGDTLWTKEFSSLGKGIGHDVLEDGNSGFVICGSISGDVLLMKVDEWGNFKWKKTFGGADEDEGYSLQKTTDHGFIVCGYTRSFGTELENVYWIKTDSLGNLQWQNSYSGLTVSRGLSVKQTFDGNFIICGFTNIITDMVDPFPGFLLIKVNENGDTLWTKTYSGTSGNSVVETVDHGYLICGNLGISPSGSSLALLRTDSDGSQIWMKEITLPGSWNEGRWIEKTPDDGFIISGISGSNDPASWKLLLLKTNNSGDTQWTHSYYGILAAGGNCVQPTNDQGYVACGFTAGTMTGQQDVYLVKTDENGLITGTNEKVVPPRLKVWPNPSIGKSKLEVQLKPKDSQLMLFDLTGRLQLNVSIDPGQNKTEIDVGNLPPGIYFLKVLAGTKVIGVEKVVVE